MARKRTPPTRARHRLTEEEGGVGLCRRTQGMEARTSSRAGSPSRQEITIRARDVCT